MSSERKFNTIVSEDYVEPFFESKTEYNEDGGKTVTRYNQHGEVVKQTKYNAAGTFVNEKPESGKEK